mmetsp:Transcript_4471/g.8536  ORF Transcript_4471/g.8536 Transcript_4471/m.8536 type:complete len:86 (-) Transcript_4471:293-550(-)
MPLKKGLLSMRRIEALHQSSVNSILSGLSKIMAQEIPLTAALHKQKTLSKVLRGPSNGLALSPLAQNFICMPKRRFQNAVTKETI